jgi:hypothetical protein
MMLRPQANYLRISKLGVPVQALVRETLYRIHTFFGQFYAALKVQVSQISNSKNHRKRKERERVQESSREANSVILFIIKDHYSNVQKYTGTQEVKML